MADTSIESFLAKFSSGFAHPNRYVVNFALPTGIAEYGNWMNPESGAGAITTYQGTLNFFNKVDIACHSMTMPGRTLMVADHKQIGGPFRIPYSHTYDPVTFTFYADNQLDIRRYFEIWQQAVININDNSMNFWKEYVADVYMAQLDRDGNRTYWVKLFESYPLSIGDVTYSYASTHQLTEITVSLQYRIWQAWHDNTSIGH